MSSGKLQIGNGGSTGSLSIDSAITNNATLAFNRANTIAQGTDFASVIAGTGAVIQNGTGTLVLNGVNTYTGPTSISASTLAISGGSANANTGTLSLADTAGAILLHQQRHRHILRRFRQLDPQRQLQRHDLLTHSQR